ncbi:serine/threonine-protein kinase bud32 [Lecanora helva]
MDDQSDVPPALPPLFASTKPPPTLLTQGAEALLYRTHFLLPTHPCALKYRPSKPYRHPTLDKRLTRHRILSEARTLVKCRREGVSVPAVLALDAEPGEGNGAGGGWMMVEWVEGRTVREVLVEGAKRVKGSEGEERRDWEERVKGLMGKIGRAVGKMHEAGVCHGDLTTSNMMLRPIASSQTNGIMTNGDHVESEKRELEGEIVLIDFGLAAQILQDEDRAVDLYVLERAFGSTHPEAEAGFQEVLKVYGESYKGAKVVLKRLEDVRMRGRKKSMIG